MRKIKPFVPPKPVKSCGKNCYQSRQEADAVAREQETIFAGDDLRLKSYHCSSCGKWHLTRKSGTD
ncbi:hypothetical protein FWD20_00380 [Candidatus Saccharibacteria bacterium]|nr:hypothetical protein [Candidatus Saccharibacteria bacterium]